MGFDRGLSLCSSEARVDGLTSFKSQTAPAVSYRTPNHLLHLTSQVNIVLGGLRQPLGGEL
jgi:hypothetical protein